LEVSVSFNRAVTHFAKINDDSGSGAIELIGFGLILQVPLLLLAMQLLGFQHSQLAAEAIARNALRAWVVTKQDPNVAAAQIAADFGLSQDQVTLTATCDPQTCVGNPVLLRLQVQVAGAEAIAVGKQ
jgi:hypothetical protein